METPSRAALPTRYKAEHRPEGPQPSSVTDAEWAVLAPLLARKERRGRPQQHARRAMLDAVFYVVRTGCQWRAIPETFPPFPAVWSTFRRWRDDGTLDELYDELYALWRKQSGRAAVPTAGIIDSQTVKTSEKGALAATTAARS